MREVPEKHLEAAQNGSRQASTVRGPRLRVAPPPTPTLRGRWASDSKETSRQEKTVPLTTSCGPTAESSSLEAAQVLVPA